ncbi:SRPBCC family protein [Sneathiella glossodoripedis]|uniref:SRPBCC family protein n=1 Tax=Sneathiella glossodoripedis TaxID=418853 RepID=UPI000B2B3651|nr:SRPBCC family protein [Sneathiella glossodoripedis]
MTENTNNRDLTLELVLNAPRDLIWRCWTEAPLIEQWFTPKPYTTEVEFLDLRPGGSSVFIMRGPNGEEMRQPGVYLEVIPTEKLVFTDAYTSAWTPSEKPFFTGEIRLSDAGGGKTNYTAIARHWSEEDRRAHEEMGFHQAGGKPPCNWKSSPAALSLCEVTNKRPRSHHLAAWCCM